MFTKYFKNGNISIKLDQDDILTIREEAANNAFNACFTTKGAVFAYIYNSIELNFVAAEDLITSAGNFDCYFNVYDAYTQKEYYILGQDLKKLLDGGALRLYGHDITEEELTENYY